MKPGRRRTPRWPVPVLALLVGLAVACGSAGPESPSAEAPDGTPRVPATPVNTGEAGGDDVTALPRPGSSTAIAYGGHPRQFGQLGIPGMLPDGPLPVVVLIHGGFWRDAFNLSLMDPLAVDLNRRGYATWSLEYRGVESGGWPATGEDIAAGIDHLAVLAAEYGLDLARVVVVGHSAGGQLALWAAARDRLPDGAPGSDPAVLPAAAVSLAGVNDLAAADRAGLGAGAVGALLGREVDRTALYSQSSPSELLPLGVPQLLVHGTLDGNVPPSQTDDYAVAARAAGDPVEVLPVEGGDHFVVIDPASQAWAAVAERLPELTGLRSSENP